MKVVAFLPAKGTSARIESKNMKLLNGKPLFVHTLEKLCQCDFIDEVYLDSESDEILHYAQSWLKYHPLKRDPALANNKTDGHQMFYNEVRQVEADIYIQILCTSPFISMETIRKGVEVLKNQTEYDSVVLVKRDKQYIWNEDGPVYDKHHIPNSKDLPDTIIESMGLYMIRSQTAHNLKMRYGTRPYLLTADPIESLDINQPAEFELCQIVASGIRAKEAVRFKTLSRFLCSSVLSDIMDTYNIPSVIKGLVPNTEKSKVLGRANTLKLRKLQDGEDYRGIYKGLDTYLGVVPGDIIMVENSEMAEYAYFGELNANLAIRSGAIATVVNGATRDANEVLALEYPVFSKCYCCSDIKKRATVESYGQAITMQGIRICPGDLVFADINGIVVIPQHMETEVLRKAIEVVGTEKNILEKILVNMDARDIYLQEGEF